MQKDEEKYKKVKTKRMEYFVLLGRKLKFARIEAELPQKEVVGILKEDYDITITQSLLSNYETGTRRPPIDVVVALCSIYKIEADKLIC